MCVCINNIHNTFPYYHLDCHDLITLFNFYYVVFQFLFLKTFVRVRIRILVSISVQESLDFIKFWALYSHWGFRFGLVTTDKTNRKSNHFSFDLLCSIHIIRLELHKIHKKWFTGLRKINSQSSLGPSHHQPCPVSTWLFLWNYMCWVETKERFWMLVLLVRRYNLQRNPIWPRIHGSSIRASLP